MRFSILNAMAAAFASLAAAVGRPPQAAKLLADGTGNRGPGYHHHTSKRFVAQDKRDKKKRKGIAKHKRHMKRRSGAIRKWRA